jgi:NAD(P)-dependent dehydrogenase (short-subunit alcohol dehydrogenase family)
MCEGRVAIVTGAGRGIGREYALMLAQQGARVVVNDLGSARDGTGADASPAEQVVDEITAMGGQASVNGADVSDFDAASEMIVQAVETFGGLDIVVNNAGILRDRMLSNMTEEEWDLVIKVHLKGPTTRGSSTRHRCRESTATSDRRTTARQSRASPALRSSLRLSWRATA